MGGQDNTAWSSSTWTPRAASLRFKGPVSTGSYSRVRIGPPGDGRVRHLQGNSAVVLRPIPCFTSTLPLKTRSPFPSPKFFVHPFQMGDGDKKCATPEGSTSLLGPGTSNEKEKHPKPRPRRRGLNREQQRGGRKPRATLAARWARGGVVHCVGQEPRSLLSSPVSLYLGYRA